MLFLLVVAVLNSAVTAQNVNRIIGGEECCPHSQPWQVALYYFDLFYCGGVLINECWVLTAAHCYMTNIQIRLGAHNLTSYGDMEQVTFAEKNFTHCGFNNTTYDNDIMLLKLASRARINPTIQVIPLAVDMVEVGTICLTSGWGTMTSLVETYPEVLQCVNVSVVSEVICVESYTEDEITSNMLCAGNAEGGRDSCQGDSGGPLVCDSVLHGITSWGHRPCGEPNKPGIYTRVVNYISWIQEIMDSETLIAISSPFLHVLSFPAPVTWKIQQPCGYYELGMKQVFVGDVL
ncbi:trypsin-like [Pelodytes ibericus]